MTSIIYPDSILQIMPFRSKCLYELVNILYKDDMVSGILLGGSLAYKNDFEKSDIDLFCLVTNYNEFQNQIHKNLSGLSRIDKIIFQGNFPWTENLYTIYFEDDIDFSIDLCLISFEKAESFFWEPDGHILFDKIQVIATSRKKQINSDTYTRHPFLKPNPFSLAVISLKKIEKNLSRGHLWNALEQLNIFRRYIMQVIRIDVIKDDFFLGRVDRDIEDVLPIEINTALANTTAIYDLKDIAKKAVLLIEILLKFKETLENSKESLFQDWIKKQLQNESEKLRLYF